MGKKNKDHATEPELLAARDALRGWLAATTGATAVGDLDEALTHGSYAHEHPGTRDYQRLEFLGDAVLQFCVSEVLFAERPTADEGALTRLRRDLVSATALARFAADHGFGPAVALGRGKRAEGVNEKVLANVAESVLAAVFRAGGMDAARAYTAALVADAEAAGTVVGDRDPKEALQEWSQEGKFGLPVYTAEALAGRAGYRVTVAVGGTILGAGEAATKQGAERLAARAALTSATGSPPAPAPTTAG